MYEVFYNLRAEPFRLSPDHKFCYEHKGYAKARAYMTYALKRAEGFVVVTGRPGTGKTTLIGELIENLSGENISAANLVCTQLQADDLLKSVTYSFGIGSAMADKAELLQRLNVLLQRWHREGRRALLIVDEAQDLSPSAMEELRLLTNIQVGGQPLLQIFLLGQPELRDLILSPEMEQVHQRIVAASHLQGLELEETEAYVLHRLTTVGWKGDPALSRAIFPLIYKFSEGVPRRINLICSRLFLLGSVEQRHAIDSEDVKVVIRELQAENLAAGKSFSEGDFLVSGEPDWVVVPGGADSAAIPVVQQLRAVATAPTGNAADGAGRAPEDPKKKVPPRPVARLESVVPSPESGDGPAVEAPPQFVTATASDSQPSAAVAPQTGPLPVEPAPQSTANAARINPPAVSGLFWRRTLLVSVVAMLLVALLLFAFIVVFQQDGKAYQKSLNRFDPAAEARTAIPEVMTPSPPAAVVQETAPAQGLVFEDSIVHRTAQEAAPEVEESDSSVDSELSTPFENTTDARGALEAPIDDGGVAARALEELESVSTGDSTGAVPLEAVGMPGPDALPENEFEAVPMLPEVEPEPILEDRVFRINFLFDSAELLPRAYAVLEEVVTALAARPDSIASITGFSDSRGDELYNLELSRQRAQTVEGYLLELGVGRGRLQVEGRGVLSEPVEADGGSDFEAMQQYRIVQITISSDTD